MRSITIPHGNEGEDWVIAAPWLKLSLKYGLIGPWSVPNWSVDFDSYAMTRGPSQGMPNLVDAIVTRLMSSRMSSSDTARLADWMRLPDSLRLMRALRKCLLLCDGFFTMPDETLRELARVVDKIDEIPGIGPAKAFKWLSAWSPKHIPMIDNEVICALSGNRKRGEVLGTLDYLMRLRAIGCTTLPLLTQLGADLGIRLKFPCSLPAVRVLDSLIWFDWVLEKSYAEAFAHWISCERTANAYKLTAMGMEYEATYSYAAVDW